MRATTQKCHQYGHPEFVLEYENAAAPFVSVLTSWIENSVAHGTVFHPGETVTWGWSVMVVESADEGRLTLSELDFSGVPGQRERSVTRTLVFTAKQKYVLESFGLDPLGDYPSLRKMAVKCNRFAGAAEVMLSRDASSDTDSGWFFGCAEENHDHQNPRELMGGSLYELACQKPDIIEYLAMPVGTIIVLDRAGRLVSALDGNDQPLAIREGFYLDAKKRQ